MQFPHTTGAFGSVVEGAEPQHSTALTFRAFAILLYSCTRDRRSTGSEMLYSRPAGGRQPKSCTATEVVPSYSNPEPQSTQKATNSLLPAVDVADADVQKMVEEGKFREDLWYRLNVVRLTVPPLCERTSDIPLLVHYFLKRYNERYGLATKITDTGVKSLEDYSWPGNIRQLQHLMERLTILAPGGRIDKAVVETAIEQMDSRDHGNESLAEAETDQIRRVLTATNGNKTRAAKILGIERKTLYRKLQRMEL